MRCPPKQLFKGGRLCAFSPLVVAALLLVLLCFFSPSFVVLSARGAEVVPTSGAASIESNFPDAAANAASALTTNADAAGYPTRARIPLAGMVASVASALVSRSVAAFKSSQPTFEARLDVAPLSVQVKQAFFSRGGYDFAVSTSSPSTSDFQKMPSLAYYPLNGNGVVFTYNLPTEVSNGQTLALTGAALCRIYRGNITRWDDPALVVANPTMALGGSAAAGKLIRVMFMTTSSATVLAFTRYCGKIDPLFKSLIPAKGLPTYPSTLYSFNYTDLDQMNSGVSDNLFSFAMTALSNAAEVNLPVGAFLNAQGNTPVLPSSSSMALTLFELATNGYPAGLSEFDLTNPSTAQAWPIMTMSYLFVDRTGAVSTCANKKMLLQYLLYIYGSPVVRRIAESLSQISLPEVFVQQLRLLEQLQADLSCLGAPVLTSTDQVGSIAVNALVGPVVTPFSSFYLAVDTNVQFGAGSGSTAAGISESLAVQRVVLGENALAVVNAHALTDFDVGLLRDGRSELIPAFLAGVVPTFSLPFALSAFAALPSTEDLDLPPLLPLRMDMELLARLFIGDVVSWLDADMVALNPQLEVWFAAAATASGGVEVDKTLQLLVGATSPSDPLSGAKLLFHHFDDTLVAASNEWAFVPPSTPTGPLSNPFLPAIALSLREPSSRRANFTMIDVESRLTTKLSTMSGTVSYRPLGEVADPSVEFQWADARVSGGVVESSVESMYKCGASFSNPPGASSWPADQVQQHLSLLRDPATQRHLWVNSAAGPEVGCWPLTMLLSFAAKMSYSSSVDPGACSRGLHALEFINYMQSTSILTAPAESLGVVRLAKFDLVARLSKQLLRTSTCDGEALLVVLPHYWSVSSSVTGFGQAIAGIGLVVVLASLVAVVTFRHKVVIRSSSLPFLCVILVGMALMLAAMVPWAVVPTRSSCSSFLWLINLGFMLLFCPLFAKTWRVYRIFSGSHLKVVKISNMKLLLVTACVVVMDIALIGAWQGVAPMVPVEYERVIGSEQHVFTHCSVDSASGSGSGLVFVALVGAEKSALLLFGAVMAFSTRNVKGAFNESVQISWAIYNTLLSALIGVAIIVFVKAVEDALVLLVLLLLMWVVFTAWGLVFAPKLYMLFLSDEKIIEASRSQLTQEKSNGFSFASIAAMTTGQVKQFYVALKLQVNKAERLLEVPLTKWAVSNENLLPSPDEPTLAPATSKRSGGGVGGGSRFDEQRLESRVAPFDKGGAPLGGTTNAGGGGGGFGGDGGGGGGGGGSTLGLRSRLGGGGGGANSSALHHQQQHSHQQHQQYQQYQQAAVDGGCVIDINKSLRDREAERERAVLSSSSFSLSPSQTGTSSTTLRTSSMSMATATGSVRHQPPPSLFINTSAANNSSQRSIQYQQQQQYQQQGGVSSPSGPRLYQHPSHNGQFAGWDINSSSAAPSARTAATIDGINLRPNTNTMGMPFTLRSHISVGDAPQQQPHHQQQQVHGEDDSNAAAAAAGGMDDRQLQQQRSQSSSLPSPSDVGKADSPPFAMARSASPSSTTTSLSLQASSAAAGAGAGAATAAAVPVTSSTAVISISSPALSSSSSASSSSSSAGPVASAITLDASRLSRGSSQGGSGSTAATKPSSRTSHASNRKAEVEAAAQQEAAGRAAAAASRPPTG